MANTKSAAKRARQTERRTLANQPVLTGVKNQLKAVRVSLKAGKKEESKALVQHFVSAIDKAAKTGRVHRNAANRHKSALARALAAPPSK
ncbi:MAG: 30S ribosomal protein S20 [Verrucomicrobiota bacterium]|nr:30S ribosomal protein S20 [Verrucomicrobiota bacterium]